MPLLVLIVTIVITGIAVDASRSDWIIIAALYGIPFAFFGWITWKESPPPVDCSDPTMRNTVVCYEDDLNRARIQGREANRPPWMDKQS